MHRMVGSILDWKSSRAFFSEFFLLNQPDISFRKFASKIGWPVSYLNDVISGRRGLTVSRAVEFAKFFEFTGVETEHLVMLALRDLDSPSIREFVDQKLNPEAYSVTALPAEPERHEVSSEFGPGDLMKDHAAMALHALFVWSRGELTASEVGELLDTFPEFSDPLVVKEKTDLLREAGVVTGEFPHIVVVHHDIVSGGVKTADIFQSLKRLEGFTRNPEKRTNWTFGTMVIRRKSCAELNQRLRELRNWINAQSDSDSVALTPEQIRKNYVVVNYHLCVSHLLNLKKLGLALKPHSRFKHVVVAENETLGL